jgi:hypothetical protein
MISAYTMRPTCFVHQKLSVHNNLDKMIETREEDAQGKY